MNFINTYKGDKPFCLLVCLVNPHDVQAYPGRGVQAVAARKPLYEQGGYQQKHKKHGMSIYNTLQTNAVTLDDAWCEFFAEHNFLLGVSLDGPQPLHDAYRVDKGGAPTFERVMAGIRLLQKHGVEFNILTTVHAENADHPLDICFMRDEIGTPFMQFIPIVERDNDTGYQEGSDVTERSVGAEQYGKFLTTIFDEWVRHDVGCVFVQIFDVALAAWTGNKPGLCIFEETCGTALEMEHDGDVYSCDHYVEPAYKLGNINTIPLSEIVVMDKQREFGLAKARLLVDTASRLFGSLDENLSQFAKTERLTITLDDVITTLNSTEAFAQQLRDGRSDTIDLINLELDTLKARSVALQIAIDEISNDIAHVKARVPHWINLASFVITLLLVWISIAQCSLLYTGWQMVRRRSS